MTFDLKRDNGWGHPVNGSWTGMIRTLLMGEADFISASLTMSTIRLSAINYLLPVGSETSGMIIKKDGLEEYSWLTFFVPLQNIVWYFLLANCIVLVLFMRLIETHYACNQIEKPNWSLFGTFSSASKDFWTIFSSYFGGGGGNHNQKRACLRVLLLVAFLVNNAVFMSYKASLTAELAVRRETLPFSALQDLFESEYRLAQFSFIPYY